jgi:hypothetical protein
VSFDFDQGLVFFDTIPDGALGPMGMYSANDPLKSLVIQGTIDPTTVVPIPGAVILFGSAIAGLTLVGRRRSRSFANGRSCDL